MTGRHPYETAQYAEPDLKAGEISGGNSDVSADKNGRRGDRKCCPARSVEVMI